MTLLHTLEADIARRWQQGTFFTRWNGALPASSYPGVAWVPYETFMLAQLIDCTPGQLGKILVKFPPDMAEDNKLHTHPASDRIITVIAGSGEFIAQRPSGAIEHLALIPGNRIWMPRNVLHTLLAGPQGLLVESLHNPWMPITDPQCLVYPA